MYLYKDGNEYTSITGGWEIIGVSKSTLQKESNRISWSTDGSSIYQLGIAQPKNAIDFSQYSKIGLTASMSVSSRTAYDSECNTCTAPYITPIWHSNKQTTWQDDGIVGPNVALFYRNTVGNTAKTSVTTTIPIKDKPYLHLRFGTSRTYSVSQTYLYEVWLEK